MTEAAVSKTHVSKIGPYSSHTPKNRAKGENKAAFVIGRQRSATSWPRGRFKAPKTPPEGTQSTPVPPSFSLIPTRRPPLNKRPKKGVAARHEYPVGGAERSGGDAEARRTERRTHRFVNNDNVEVWYLRGLWGLATLTLTPTPFWMASHQLTLLHTLVEKKQLWSGSVAWSSESN